MVHHERMSQQHRSDSYPPFGYFPHFPHGSQRIGEDPVILASVSGAIMKEVASL
ncbi:hypothetical protein PIB30_101589, partial [Stylosanthes scabra]|nr:hypothetical protein [Stylosanthes scabra]